MLFKDKNLTGPDLCPSCKKKQIKLVRLFQDGKLPSQNFTFVCVNPECSLKIDLKKVENWKKTS